MQFKKLWYIVSEFSHPKGVVIVIIIDNVISPNEKLIKTLEGQPTFDVIRKYLYEKSNPFNGMMVVEKYLI